VKRIVSIVFALIFFSNFVGFYVNFQFEKIAHRKAVKKEMKMLFSAEEMTPFSAKALKQLDCIWYDDAEFSVAGKMFDVVKSDKAENNEIIYWCISDDQEDELNLKLAEFLDDEATSEKEKSSKNSKISKDETIEMENFEGVIVAFLQNHKKAILPDYFFSLQLGESVHLFPPPNFPLV
jgi:hypothetical protein